MDCSLIVNTFNCLDQVTWPGIFIVILALLLLSLGFYVVLDIRKSHNKGH